MAKSIRSSKNLHQHDELSCGVSDNMSATDLLADAFFKNKLKENIDKRNSNLERAKEEKLSGRSAAGAPYITHSQTRSGSSPYTFIPVIFHVFMPDPQFNITEYFPDTQAGLTVTLMNQMVSGVVTEKRLNYTGYHTGYADSKTVDWLTNYNSATTAATFTSAINHPDHGVEASFRFKIPNKIKKSELLNADNVFNPEMINAMFPSGQEYIQGGEHGVIFRYPFDKWTANQELRSIAGGSYNFAEHSLIESVRGLHVFITDVDSKPSYGGVASFPTKKINFFCNLNGANIHHRPYALAEVLLHEIGHCFLLRHTHGNVAFKEQDGELWLGQYNLTDTNTLASGTQFRDGVGLSPPRYLNENEESVFDLDPLTAIEKEYVEFVFKEQAKLTYSFWPSIEHNIISDITSHWNLANNYLSEAMEDYSPYDEEYSNNTDNMSSLEGFVLGANYKQFMVDKTALLTGKLSVMYYHNKINSMFNATAISGLPFWGGSQAYDPVKGENVIVLNPVGNSEKSVGNVYDSTIGNQQTSSLEDLGVSEGGVFFYTDEENQVAYVFETTLHGQLNHADALAYAENYTGGGFSDWSLPTFEQLIVLSENTDVFDARQFASQGKIWTNEITDTVLGESGAFYMHPEGFWTGTAGQPGAWQQYNSQSSSSTLDFILVRSFSLENVTIRRGPSVNGEAINRIPFCVLDENGNQTTEYDPLWARYRNQFNPAYPAYPNNYPLTEWANLNSTLCPCLNAEQTTGDITYYPKTISDDDLLTVYVTAISERFDIDFNVANDIYKDWVGLSPAIANGQTSVVGSTNPDSNMMMTWRFDNEQVYPVGLFYYGFDATSYHKGYKYESNPDIGLYLPALNEGEDDLEVFTGAMFYQTGISDLRKSVTMGTGVNHRGLSLYNSADLDALVSYSSDDFLVGPYTDLYGNEVTINLKNPLKEYYGLSLKSYRRSDPYTGEALAGEPSPVGQGTAHTFWNSIGDDMFENYPELYNVIYYDPPSFFVPQVNYPGSYEGARKTATISSSADNFFHPDGITNGFKFGTDDLTGITYRDITNVMQYPPELYNSSLDDFTSDEFREDILGVDKDVNTVTPSNFIDLTSKYMTRMEVRSKTYAYYYLKIKREQLELVKQSNYTVTSPAPSDIIGGGGSLYNTYYAYGSNNAFDLGLEVKNYSFLPYDIPLGSNNSNPPVTDPNMYGEQTLISRTGFRCTYSPEQIFYIESLLEYCDIISYEEINGFAGQFTGFQYGEYSTSDSAYNVARGVKDLLELSKDLDLNQLTLYNQGDSEISQIINGKSFAKNLCGGETETSFLSGAVKITAGNTPETSEEALDDIVINSVGGSSRSTLLFDTNSRLSPQSQSIRVTEEDQTLVTEPEYTVIENLYTYGNTIYRLDGTDYIGYYHAHSNIGIMEGAAHSEVPHNLLKYYYQLDPLGSKYKNKTRRANNFNKIYKSIFKIL